MEIKTPSYVLDEYTKSISNIKAGEVVRFLIDVLKYIQTNIPNILPNTLKFFEAYDENYLINLKNSTTGNEIPEFVILSVIKDEPASIGGVPFNSAGNRMVVPRDAPDNAYFETQSNDKKYSIMVQDRDVLVSFKCYSKTDDTAYKLLKKIEHVLFYLRKLFGKYGINTSFTYGMPISSQNLDKVDKITKLTYKELVWYFRIQEVYLKPILAVLESVDFNDLLKDDGIIINS